jgi:hypothetical protein
MLLLEIHSEKEVSVCSEKVPVYDKVLSSYNPEGFQMVALTTII